MAKRNTKKTPKTMDGYFRAIQEDLLTIHKDMATGFRAIREEMATKQELGEVRSSIKDLRADVKMITDVMVSKADLGETVRRELDASPFARESEVKDLRGRLAVVERKLGIERSRHAA